MLKKLAFCHLNFLYFKTSAKHYLRKGKKILANIKKIKNPPTSVKVVKKIDEAIAGSMLTFFNKIGMT